MVPQHLTLMTIAQTACFGTAANIYNYYQGQLLFHISNRQLQLLAYYTTIILKKAQLGQISN